MYATTDRHTRGTEKQRRECWLSSLWPRRWTREASKKNCHGFGTPATPRTAQRKAKRQESTATLHSLCCRHPRFLLRRLPPCCHLRRRHSELLIRPRAAETCKEGTSYGAPAMAVCTRRGTCACTASPEPLRLLPCPPSKPGSWCSLRPSR
ncbi:hypothetical protein MUK42_20865 [Musa troglodytarum]|uniref:Uncharacterized protein n=1 Tax=Musa troglodytarum TaxID=320322 RepID=A0A9E7K602_9LILI|nr:hypothetical protein MUK42_20865 [Musa troglodytarum]